MSTSSRPSGEKADPNWWRQAAVYQIYPRSFADANGDGIGDIAGITSRVDYLVSLGIDAVWLSPFYPSALADGGYDVDDYRDVDPTLGTLADFDQLVDALHSRDLKLIVDLVPNHSSNRHAWFVEALAAAPGSPARARYIFRDGLGADGSQPPSDWESRFGGSAWTRVPDGQWYLHLFAPEQPDLNWDNPEVREDFRRTIRFWADRGVDGFRVDVAHGLAKDMNEPLPSRAELTDALLLSGKHPYEDRDDVHEIFTEWRRVFNEYDPPLAGVAEAWVDRSRRSLYARATELGQAFNFDLLDASWSASSFQEVIGDSLADAARTGTSSTWVLSNHDVIRHATRYGIAPELTAGDSRGAIGRQWLRTRPPALAGPGFDPVLGLRRARAATMLMLALPGSAYLYQGEELGLLEVTDLPDEARQDPIFARTNHVDPGRDGCRVPLPWTRGGPSFGFGAGGSHLPQPPWFGPLSVESESDEVSSTLSLYRHALALRHRLQSAEELSWVTAAPRDVLHLTRPGGWHSITNFGTTACPLPDGDVVLSSEPLQAGQLGPDATAWVVVAAP